MTRLRAAAAVAALAVAIPGAFGALGADRLPTPTRCSDGVVQRLGDWESIKGPEFTPRPLGAGQEITSYAVAPYAPQRRWVTNGTSVERTDDSGCTWREVHVLPAAPTDEDPQSVATSRIVELVVPEDERAGDRLLLVVQDEGGAPHVLVSDDGGIAPFSRRDDGLPARADATDLLVAASNPEFLFLSVQIARPTEPAATPAPLPVPDLPVVPPLPGTAGPAAAASPGALYASVDGGRTWEPRVDVTDLGPTSDGIDRLAGDPIAPNRLWALSDGVLRASVDGGRTFDGPGPTPEQQRARGWTVTAVVAATRPSQPARVLALSSTSAQGGGPRLLRSTDGGRSYDEAPAPGPVGTAVLVGADRDLLAVSTTDDPARLLTAFAPFGPDPVFTERTPLPTRDALAVSTDRSGTPTLHARASRVLLRYLGAAVAVRPPAASASIGAAVGGMGLPPLTRASLTPASVELVLPAGGQRTVQHVLTPPRRATPLDLYVLLDTSESMLDDLDRVRADLAALVARLRAQGLDVQVGLGEFKGGESSVAYRRVVGIGPDVGAFTRGLASLRADGFGEEAQLIALEQALTGRGETSAALVPAACKLGPSDPDRFVRSERRTAPPVTPGQQADFRPGAVPVVLTVTDTNFLRPAGTPLTPACRVDVAGVAQRYRTAGIYQVGLGLDDVDNPQRAADLLQGAAITGALQPAGTVCAPGIAAGPQPPAVCRRAVDLAPSLARLTTLTAEPVDLEIAVAAGSRTVRPQVARLAGVDLRGALPAVLPVTYSCQGLSAGRYVGGVEVRLAGRAVAAATARVTCQPPPLAPPAPRLALPESLAVTAPVLALLPPPAVPPPPPPPAQGLQTQAQTQPQAQAQSQLQTGTQDQQQAQAELALALQDDRDEQ
ncbi:MAG: hypothetical protein H7323_08985, partial [Frankiales bacterium]|nr:hypothetical protein [Frankiales bacterium]